MPFHELGWLEVQRATDIEFNNITQNWQVRDQKGQLRFRSRFRSECLEWEHENLQFE